VSLALDAQGNPCASYAEARHYTLRFADSAIHLVSPLGGERWAAGSQQMVEWKGSGAVTIQLSQDGGATFTTLLSGITSNVVPLTVPGYTTERARVRVSRTVQLSTSDSPGTFAIAPGLVNPWWSKTVDSPGAVGRYTSLALDAQGSPHISYADVTNGDLRHATKSGGSWALETVDAAGTVGQFTSLALDAQGDPRIGYYDGTNGDLKYASESGGTWSTEIVDAAGDAGWYPSLALDPQGNPRIAYYYATTTDLRYASKSGGVWTIGTVDAAGTVGWSPSLALDGQGSPRVSYYDSPNGNLKFASQSGGSWTAEVVDTARDVGLYSSLALDSRGDPHISYYDGTNDDLKYASRSAGAWTIETLDAAGTVGWHTSLVLDANDEPHITYYDFTNGDLRYARRSGGVWIFETVDAGGDVGQYTSLALDAQGNPRISYYDVTRLDLKYASAAIELSDPAPGTVWPVGASRAVTWEGTGLVDLHLSVDGGASWQLYETGLSQGEHRLVVPHLPSRFAAVKLERAVPHSVSKTPGLFTLETSISLLSFAATLAADGGGADLTWRSDPGPEDLAGYRVERAAALVAGGWRTVVPLTRATQCHDAAGAAGAHYRLLAVNGLGEELALGEVALMPARPLAAWPLPYRGGELSVSFGVAGGIGATAGQALVELYDITGRRVRSLVDHRFAPGYYTVAWDGRDGDGHAVRSGIYFLRLRTGGERHELKLVALP
jgi:hypothetical protein